MARADDIPKTLNQRTAQRLLEAHGWIRTIGHDPQAGRRHRGGMMTDVQHIVVGATITRDDDGWYVAEVVDYPGCFASAETLDELGPAMADALSVYLSSEHVRVVVTSMNPTTEPLFCAQDRRVSAQVELALA